MDRLTMPRNADGTVSQPTDMNWYSVLDKLTNYEDAEERNNCSEKSNGWISVEDKLPEKFKNVLCFFPEKGYGSKVGISYFESDSGVCADAFRFGTPTHWMPLPSAEGIKHDT